MKLRKAVTPWLILLTTIFILPSAFAVPLPDHGWYAGGGLGFSSITELGLGNGARPGEGGIGNSGIGGNANVGYKFAPYFATEFGLNSYARTKIMTLINNTSTSVGNVISWSSYITLKGLMPVSASNGALFAKLGVARVVTHLNQTDGVTLQNVGVNTSNSLYFGLGGEYAFLPYLAGVVQWTRIKGTSATGTLDMASIGVAYLFG